MARLRSPAQRAPQTLDQARVLAERFALRAGFVGEVEARRAALHARVDALCDAKVVPILADMKDISKQLKPWFEGNFQELTGGKRKSIPLAGCIIGYRISPPKVAFAGGTDDVAADVLIAASLGDTLVRTKHSPDKPAILKLLELVVPEQGDDDAAGDDPRLLDKAKLLELGFEIKQPEVFFVDLAAKSDAEPSIDVPA